LSLATDLRMALDPVETMKAAGMEADPWQARVLRSSAPRQLLLCGRQSGKTTATAALAAHTAIYRPGSLTLVVSPSLRQSAETFRQVMTFIRAIPGAPRADTDSILRTELANGSRVLALPGSEETLRGFAAVSLLVIDEAARVEDGLYLSLRPMLAVSHGKLLALSSPWMKAGWFYKSWISQEPWERTRVAATEIPRISREFLAEEERTMPRAWFLREYCAEFTDAEDGVFRDDDIQRAISSEIAPLFGGTSSWNDQISS
jgi:hypothetical protein